MYPLMPPIRSSHFFFWGGQPPPKQQISPQCADVAHVMPILSKVPVGRREWRKTSEKQRHRCFISNPKIGGFPCFSTADFLSAFLAAKKGQPNTTHARERNGFSMP